MRLSGDNGEGEEDGEEVLKEEQVINDFFSYNSRIFLEVSSLCPVHKILAVNFFKEWSGVGGILTKNKTCSHSHKQQKALTDKGGWK